jgi:hypothetical protein
MTFSHVRQSVIAAFSLAGFMGCRMEGCATLTYTDGTLVLECLHQLRSNYQGFLSAMKQLLAGAISTKHSQKSSINLPTLS